LRDVAGVMHARRMVAVFEDDAFLIRRSARGLGVSAAFAAVVTLCAAAAVSAGFVALGCWLAWVGLGGIAYGWVRSPGGVPRPVRLSADARGLSVDGVTVLPASGIAGGWVQPRSRGAPLVHVRGRGRHLRFIVRDVESGRALLGALEVDAARVTAQFWAMARPLGEPRAFAHTGLLLAFVVFVGLVAGRAAPPVFAVALVSLIVLFAGIVVPTRVVVGGDGVLLRWLGTARFVPWSRVTDVDCFDGGVTLALRAGERLTVRTPADHERYNPERDAMVERMTAALRSHGPAPRSPPMAPLLRRAGGRTPAWVRSMRALAKSEVGFRHVSTPLDALWQVVEDPRAEREVRMGAAIALAPTLHAADRARLRAAASGCAEPRLRIALTTTAVEAHSSDDALAEALDALEGEAVDDSGAS
jgi:hypothetical protein